MSRPRHQLPHAHRPQTNLQATVPLPTPVPARNEIKRQGTEEFARERQLRDYRRANGLCFKCGDKYSKEHQCKKPMQLMTIEIGEFGEVLTDDTLQSMKNTDTPEECFTLSVHAIAGTEEVHFVRLCALVKNQVMLILVDSGSTHSFVNRQFVMHLPT